MSRPCMALAIGVILLAGCASTGLQGNVYRGDGFAFRIVEPNGTWQSLGASAAALAYRNDETNATILVNARCGLDGDDVPLRSLTQHLFLQFTEREVQTEEIVAFDGREALHTVLNAKLDGVRMRYDVWVMKKDGCVFDLLYLAPPASFDQGHAAFTSLVQGFATVDAGD